MQFDRAAFKPSYKYGRIFSSFKKSIQHYEVRLHIIWNIVIKITEIRVCLIYISLYKKYVIFNYLKYLKWGRKHFCSHYFVLRIVIFFLWKRCVDTGVLRFARLAESNLQCYVESSGRANFTHQSPYHSRPSCIFTRCLCINTRQEKLTQKKRSMQEHSLMQQNRSFPGWQDFKAFSLAENAQEYNNERVLCSLSVHIKRIGKDLFWHNTNELRVCTEPTSDGADFAVGRSRVRGHQEKMDRARENNGLLVWIEAKTFKRIQLTLSSFVIYPFVYHILYLLCWQKSVIKWDGINCEKATCEQKQICLFDLPRS